MHFLRRLFGRGILLVCVFASLLIGCSNAKMQQIYAPDGRVAYAVSCVGDGWHTWTPCFELAGEVCKQAGYQILDRSEGMRRTMVIVCRPLPDAVPTS
jgi:hypothetical protein